MNDKRYYRDAFTRLVGGREDRALLFWGTLGAVYPIFAYGCPIAANLMPGERLSIALLGCAVFAVVLGLILCRRQLLALRHDLEPVLDTRALDIQDALKRYDDIIDFYKTSWSIVLTGLAFSAIVFWAFWDAGVFRQANGTMVPLWGVPMGFIVLAGGVGGLGLGYTIVGMVAFYRLGTRLAFLSVPGAYGIHVIGQAIFTCFAIIYAALLFFISGAIAITYRPGNVMGIAEVANTPVLFIAIPLLLGLLVGFFACQWPIHTQLLEQKRAHVQHLLETYRSQARTAASGPLDLRDVDDLPSWPFSLRSGVGATVLALSSSVVTVVVEVLS